MVEAVGEKADPAWIGKQVGVFPLIPCYDCGPCRARQYEMCRNYGYLGSRQDGGFAEYVTVPVKNLIELPAGVSIEAAAMFEPMAVAVHAIRRAEAGQSGSDRGLRAGDDRLVCAYVPDRSRVSERLCCGQ